MGLLYGLDISKYQGDFDFNNSPLKDFVIIRCGYTGQTSNECYKDEKFDRNLREIKKTNIPYGFYYYSCAKNESDAKREADFIHSLLKDEKFELPLFIDYEYSKVINSLGTKKCNEVIESLGKKLESYGYFVGLYSYEYFLKNATDRFWLWIASYGTNDGTVKKDFNNGKYKMYQFTSQYNGKYDANVLYDASVMKTIREKGLNGFSKQQTDNNVETPKKEENTSTTLKYKVGDVVSINAVYSSSDSTDKLNPYNKQGKITKIIANARNPYLLENGNIGWVNDSCIVTQSQSTLKVGSKVKIKSSAAKYATGQTIPDWVKKKTHTIQKISGEKVLLKEIVSWVYKEDIA